MAAAEKAQPGQQHIGNRFKCANVTTCVFSRGVNSPTIGEQQLAAAAAVHSIHFAGNDNVMQAAAQQQLLLLQCDAIGML